MMSLESTGTFIILIGTNKDAVPAGGSGWVVKGSVMKGELRKSCCHLTSQEADFEKRDISPRDNSSG